MSDDTKGPLPGVRAAATIPINWSSGGVTLPARSAIKIPTPSEVATFSDVRVKTCGGCAHFQHNHGQSVVSKFMALVVLEAKWKREFVAEDPSKLARCAMNDEIMTGPSSMGCDQWKDKNK